MSKIYVRADGGRLPNRPTMIRDSFEKLVHARLARHGNVSFSSLFFESFLSPPLTSRFNYPFDFIRVICLKAYRNADA